MNTQLANDLRALADRVEQLPESLRLDVALKAYNVMSLDELRAMAALMKTLTPKDSGGIHWLNGVFADRVEVTAFYATGLLGHKREIVVMSEDTDLSLLEVQS
jgi:hypothetical protein